MRVKISPYFYACWCLMLLALLPINLQAQDSLSEVTERFIPGEAILIHVPLDSSAFINGGYAIDKQGIVDFPVLGKVIVGDKTRKELEGYLASKLSDYLKDTHIQALPALRITLVGFWKKPGMYYIPTTHVLWDAIYISGGPNGEINIEKMKVLRGTKDLHISTLEEFSKGTTLAKVGIHSGDIFIIPIPDEKNGWYWFKETLTTVAQIVTIGASVATLYFLFNR